MDDYDYRIFCLLEQISEARGEFIKLCQDVIGKSLIKDDLYFLTAIDRCIRLSDGFIEIIRVRNLTCAGAILRLMIDNCLRTFAPYIAENKNEVFDTIIHSDKKLYKLKDNEGNKMTDYLLQKRIDKYFNTLPITYEQASGYIHFSDRAFYPITSLNNEREIELSIGHPLSKKCDDVFIECTEAFIHYINVFYKLVLPVSKSKERIDQDIDKLIF